MNIYHILLKYEYEAEDLIPKIKSLADFKLIASKYSVCSSSKTEGLLGSFKKNKFVEPFEEACESLQENTLSKPVKTQFGWHLIYKTKN